MDIIRTGCTRIVLLTNNEAYKIPNFTYSLEHFLKGWLANIQEGKIWNIFNLDDIEDKTIKLKLCPVLKTYLFGFCIKMPRCIPATDIPENSPIGNLCGDYKVDNYGWYEKRLVCFDYGQ